MAKRTDVHRPSAITPDDYEFVAQECMKVEWLGDCQAVLENRRIINEHMARTGGHYSGHEHGGNCMVCGSVNAIYTVLFYHRPTNTYVRLGQDCAAKLDWGGDFGSSQFRKAIEDAREATAGKRKAQALLGDKGLSAAWDIFTAEGYKGCECGAPCRCYEAWMRGRREEEQIREMVGKLVKYGSFSEAQYGLLGKLVDRIANRPAYEAKRAAEAAAAADCPAGRIEIEGTILSTREESNDFGIVVKMLVKHDTGYKVWGSMPSEIRNATPYTEFGHGQRAERKYQTGARVAFKATVTRSDKDRSFGFYSRPTNGRVITPSPAAEEKEEVSNVA